MIKHLKNSVLFLISLTIFSLLAPSTYAQFNESGWQITNFHSEIKIEKNSELNIQEEITADFSRVQKHGIYRTIPVKFKDSFNNNFTTYLEVQSVTDENNTPIPYTTSKNFDEIEIKIGDPDKLISKVITYKINYQVKRALLDQPNWDELYWNINGHDWPVSIDSATATVTLPESLSNETNEENLNAICFEGIYGANENCEATKTETNSFTFKSSGELEPGVGMTIGVKFPKGIITHPGLLQKTFWLIQENWGIFIPIIAFIILYYLWSTRGRDPKNYDSIIPQYKPPKDLTPTEVGTIIDESVDPRDISATILDLAIRGFLKIEEKNDKKLLFFNSTDYIFHLTQNYNLTIQDSQLKPHEIEIIKAVFNSSQEAKLSSLNNKFYKSIPKIKESIYDQLIAKKYFPHNPEKIRATYLTIGASLAFIAFFSMAYLIQLVGLINAMALPITAGLIMAFSFIMPRKTKKGVETLNYIKGLEEYISTAEKDRIEFYEKENLVFEKLLPYAMVLGIGKKWAEAFKDIYSQPPSWYTGSSWDTFNSLYLVDRLSSLDTTMGQTFTSAPRSSASSGGSSFGGGGFSGGGFGGGGGGSW